MWGVFPGLVRNKSTKEIKRKEKRQRKESLVMRWPPFKMGRTDRERLVWILFGLMTVFSVPMCCGMTNPSDGKSKSNVHTTSEHKLRTQLCPLRDV